MKSILSHGSRALLLAGILTGPAKAATWLSTGQTTSRPIGHVEFCQSRPSECKRQGIAKNLPAANLPTLRSVNVAINRSIKPRSDQQQFGVRERWTYPSREGDCEDYALAKRKALLRKGYPASNLLLAVGHNGIEPHTVLVVRTRDGDFVLDNQTDAILTVSAARVSIRKIQSPSNGGEWLKVTGKTSKPG
jgi:predicted transglutaminase-like cysteine proteinase